MSFLGWFLNPGYSGGIEAGEEYVKQGGKEADENTILSVYEDVGLGSAEEFLEGWREAEDNNRGFFSWLLGK